VGVYVGHSKREKIQKGFISTLPGRESDEEGKTIFLESTLGGEEGKEIAFVPPSKVVGKGGKKPQSVVRRPLHKTRAGRGKNFMAPRGGEK